MILFPSVEHLARLSGGARRVGPAPSPGGTGGSVGGFCKAGAIRQPETMAALPPWLQRWNFIERARLERQLWDVFEAGGDLDAKVAECRSAVAAGDRGRAFQLEVWETTLRRIRKIETLMRDQQAPPGA